MCINQNSRSLLALLQLISITFPIGSFSYSRGLEWAVEHGMVDSERTFIEWQKLWIYDQLMYLDWPMMKRCYICVQKNDSIKFLSCAFQILSYRDTYELRLEEEQKGKSVTNLILQWYSPTNKNWLLAWKKSGLASITWLGHAWDIPLKSLALGYAYSLLESSIMIGLKLMPFGQKKAQNIIRHLSELLPHVWVQSNIVKDFELGSSLPLQSIASSCHEIQYSRLFRS